VVATHDARVASRMRQIVHMRDGAIGTAPEPPMGGTNAAGSAVQRRPTP
jgi:ABC-type lipoprotein export system ATPase subunit